MEVEGSPYSLKRDHDSFEELADLEEPCSIPENYLEVLETQQIKQEEPASESLPTPPVSIGTKRDPSPARSTTGSLTDLGTATPHRGQSPMLGVPPASSATTSPSAFAALNGSAPPLKKTKLTFAEKEARRIEKEFKDRQKAEEKARKEAERQAHAEEKARKEAEKEAERKKREAEREEKRVAQEAEKAAKEEKRRKKEEEKQKAEEEKRKKERSQTKLGNFFSVPATRPRSGSVDSRGRNSISPAPSSALATVASPAASTPSKPGQTPYEKTFLEFYIQNGVTLAPFSRFERDEEALESIQKTIDGYLSGNRSPTRRSFDPVFLFHLSSLTPRGKACMPVREIMSEFYSGNASKPIDLTTDSQNSQIKRTGDLLRKIPMKFLQFQEDVRPAYRGTYTSRPVTGMTKLARNPMRRDLPNTDYDYDSEAEWVEDEDAEDLKSEGDEEEEVDDDEDMDGFLDDENDETANSRRLVLQGDLQPVSTGLCWEDQKKRNTNVKLIPYRMEIILGEVLPFAYLMFFD
jgi:chromatin assembly factor 1 subunit A